MRVDAPGGNGSGCCHLVLSARTAHLPIEAKHPPEAALQASGRLQRAQAAGAYRE
jgi:hypothetical protein